MPPVDFLSFILPIFAAVLLGLVLGSFLNVCIVRLPAGESVVAPASHCMHCQARIRPYDNVPVVSWFWLRGRCRDCGSRISTRYPLIEALSALLFVACLLRFGIGWCVAGKAVFCWLLLGLAVMDAETFLLPNAFTLPGLLIGVLFSALCSSGTSPGVLQALLGLAIIGGFLLLIRSTYYLIRKREGMGFGDVKLGAMLGAWLGWRLGSVALFLAIAGGACGGILLLLLNSRRVADKKQELASLRIPFGTFLSAAGIITVFAGAPLLRWYLGLFP